MRWLRLPILWGIRLYQHTLSPDHGPLRGLFPHGYCKFHPTCSEYGYQSIAQNGLLKGGWYTLWRIMRCNPFSEGGIDQPKNSHRH